MFHQQFSQQILSTKANVSLLSKLKKNRILQNVYTFYHKYDIKSGSFAQIISQI